MNGEKNKYIEQLESVFSSIISDKETYINYNKFDSGKGFSIQRNYPSDIAYHCRKFKDGTNEEIAIFYILLQFDRKDGNLIPLLITVKKAKLYEFDKWITVGEDLEINYEDPGAPTKGSVEKSLKTSKYKPIDINVKDEYFLDIGRSILVIKNSSSITAKKAFQNIFEKHIKSSQKFHGLYLRIKIKSINSYVKFLCHLSCFFIYILEKCFGKQVKIKIDDTEREEMYNPHEHDVLIMNQSKIEIKDSGKQLSFQNFPINIQSLFTYAGIMLVAFTIFYFLRLKPRYLVIIFNNKYLITIFGIASLWFVYYFVPFVLYKLINLSKQYRQNFFHRSTKI
ncbi:hypothetical protein ACFLZV_07515 [Candidatus Margulisiibacteriota bacterium]